MTEKREFELFAYIFNRDREEDQPTTESQEEDVPLMHHTVKSDEDDASNSRAAVIKQGDQSRRAQADQLQDRKTNQCNNITTPKRREFDLFAYIFNRDGEEDEPPTEPHEEDASLVDLTVDSDEDDASNSTLAVFQPQQPQSSSRLPRRVQPRKLQEPATDSEDEEEEEEEEEEDDEDDDDESSDEEATSSSRRGAVKTGTRSRRSKSNVYSLEIMKFNQLEEKDKEGAQRVLDRYRDERQQGSVHICSRFMSKSSQNLSRHMKSRHPNAKHPGYKVTQYPGFKDLKAHDFVTKPYSQMNQTDSQLAKEVLALVLLR